MAKPMERLSVALLRMRITRALQEMRAACTAWDFDAALVAQQQMDEGLDTLARWLHPHAG